MDLMALKATLSLDSSQYEQGIADASGKIKGFSGIGAAAFGAFAEAGRRAMSIVFNAVSSNMSGAISRLDTLNNFTNVMTSIGFGAEEADTAINGLADGIEKLPTTLDAVARQTQGIAAITKDLGQATDITLALNNALAAGGVGGAEAAGAIQQWTQAMAKGKPDATEWLRLVQAAPAQMDQLAQSMLGAGATTSDLQAAIKDGSVSISDLNSAMVELAQNGNKELGFTSWAEQAEKASAGIQMSAINIRAAIQRNIANVLDSLNTKLGDFGGIAGAMQSIVPVIDTIGEKIQGLISGDLSIADVLSFDPSVIIESIDAMLPTMIEKGLAWAEAFTSSLREGFGNLVSGGLEIVQHIAEGIAAAMPSLIEKIPTIVSNIAGLINDNAPKLLAAGVNIIVTLGKGLIQAIPTLVANLPQIIKAIWDVFTAFNWMALGKQLITAIGNGLLSLRTSIPNTLKSIGKSAWNGLKNINWSSLGKSILQLIGRGISALAHLPGTLLRAAGSRAMQAFTGLAWGNVGSNIIRGIARGITAGAGWIVSAAKNAAQRAFRAAKNFLGIQSPSKLFRDKIGKNIALGMALGIDDGEKNVVTAMDRLNNNLIGASPTVSVIGATGSRTATNGGDVFNINLGYNADADATDMLRDLARGVQRYRMAGAI